MRFVPLLAAAVATVAGAQTGDWSTVTPAVGVASPIGDAFEEAWAASGPVLVVRAEAPAYGGRVRGEVRHVAYDPNGAADVPPFSVTTPTAGWGPALDAGRVRLSAGPHLGIAWFLLRDPERTLPELEVAVGAWATAAVRVGRVEAWVQFDATRIALAEAVVLRTASAGLALRLDAPGWLRDVLR